MTELLSGMGYTVKLMSIKDYIATLIDPNSNQIEAKFLKGFCLLKLLQFDNDRFP